MDQLNQAKPVGIIHRIIFWVSVLFLSYTTIGFLILPSVIKIIAIKNIEGNLDRHASINIVRFNPFALSLKMNGLSIKEIEGNADFVSVKDIYVNLQSLSIFKLAPIIKNITVDYPYLNITRYKDGNFNFTDLIEKFSAETVTEKISSDKNEIKPEMFKFSLSNLLVNNGHMDILDKELGKTHKIDQLNLSVPFTSSIGQDIEKFTELQLSTNFDNATVSMSGKSKPFTDTMETSLNVGLKGLDLANYFEYIPFELNIVLSSANLDAKNTIHFAKTKEKGEELSIVGDVIVKDLAIIDKQNNPFFNLDLNHIVLSRSNILKGEITLGSISMESPHFWISRESDGTINVNKLIEQIMVSDTEESPVKSDETVSPFDEIVLTIEDLDIKDSRVMINDLFQTASSDKAASMEFFKMNNMNINKIIYEMANERVAIGEVLTNEGQCYAERLPNGDLNIELFTNIGISTDAKTETPSSDSATPLSFLVQLENLAVNDFSIFCRNIVDEQDKDIVIDVVKMKGKNISTKPDSKGNIDLICKLNETASINVTGEMCIDPIKANMNLNVSDIDLTPYQPFISYFIEDAPKITISSGKLSSDGDFSFALSDSNDISGGFKGNATISEFLLSGLNDEKLVAFGSLKITKAEAEIEPIFANVESIALNEFKCFASINEDGTINFQNIFPTTETKVTEQINSSVDDTEINNKDHVLKLEDEISNYMKAYPVNLDELSINESNISFIDYSIKPNFSMEISDISGSVTNLSTEKASDAKIDVNAKINNYAPAKIGGSINLLEATPFADISLKLNDMDLTSMSPYTGKYIGYNVRKGKLTLDLSYLIELINLNSLNNLLVNQFELGERVESPDAIKAPIKLGLALLKDRKGNIKLDVPISGRIDDPKFNIGGIIVQAIKNIIVKAATSPFKFIASVFGGSEDIKYIEFSAGSTILSHESKSKLDVLITALYERPGIEMEVSGFIDKYEDINILVSNLLTRMVKNEKLMKMKNREKLATSLNDITFETDEYDKYLRALYETKYADSAPNKEITVPEIEALIKSKIEISDNEIMKLIDNRMQNVNSYILDSGKVEGERIFLVESQSKHPKNIENIKSSRIELDLK